jgi:hypothetical protein
MSEPDEASVGFEFAGGEVSYATCPPMPSPRAQLTVPVLLTFRQSKFGASTFHAKLTATRGDQVSLSGRLDSTSGSTALGLWMDDDDVDILVGGPSPSSVTRWSTLCDVKPRELLATKLGELERLLSRERSHECAGEETSAAASRVGSIQAPGLVLTRSARHACRRSSQKDVRDLAVEVRSQAGSGWLGGALRGTLSFDVRRGLGELALAGEVGASETLRALFGCNGNTSIWWKKSFHGDSHGLESSEDIIELASRCVDRTLRCRASPAH